MKTRFVLWIMALSGLLGAAGCAPAWDRSYYGYPAYYGSYAPYYGDLYGPGLSYYSYSPYYEPYYYSPYYEPYYVPYRSHAREHEVLEHKYNKAMNRLARQERTAEEKLARRYGGNMADPRFQERERRIEERYAYKRGKVERNLAREHRRYHRG